MLLLLLVAGAAASTSLVNGTCPATAPTACDATCCDSSEVCLLGRWSKHSCQSKYYLPVLCGVIIPCVFAFAAFVVYNQQKRGRQQERDEPPTENYAAQPNDGAAGEAEGAHMRAPTTV